MENKLRPLNKFDSVSLQQSEKLQFPLLYLESQWTVWNRNEIFQHKKLSKLPGPKSV